MYLRPSPAQKDKQAQRKAACRMGLARRSPGDAQTERGPSETCTELQTPTRMCRISRGGKKDGISDPNGV